MLPDGLKVADIIYNLKTKAIKVIQDKEVLII